MSVFPAIAELVPHERPMLCLEELTEWTKGHAVGRMTVREDNLFVRHGRLDSVVSIELMGQAIAACLGMEAYSEGGNVRVGMIIACRTLRILRPWLPVGEQLTIRCDCVRGTDSLSHYDGVVFDGAGEKVAEATMTLVHGEKPPDQA
ncbi:MAG: hypothetical protein H6835_19650 [Planctomycetes bacterium]|nr:hypothetical protein [Planctomycetota bacterium]